MANWYQHHVAKALTKLWTILLLEADFNMNNKKLSRKGMWAAERYGCVAPEQAGG